jgi:hypothetical protein
MTEKNIKFNFIKKIIKDNAHLFPKEISIIKLYFPNDKMEIDFIDTNEENITQMFLNRVMSDGETIYKKMLLEISTNPKLENLEKEFVYIHNAKFKSNLKAFINGSEIRKIMGKETTYSISPEIGISSFVLWNMVSDSKNDYRLSIIFKICDYFKVSLFRILNKEYGKELLAITLREFAAKAMLTEDECKVLTKIKESYYK